MECNHGVGRMFSGTVTFFNKCIIGFTALCQIIFSVPAISVSDYNAICKMLEDFEINNRQMKVCEKGRKFLLYFVKNTIYKEQNML